jgi:lysophospholipase L1-like esterase
MKKLFLLMSAMLLLSITAAARPRTLWMVGDGTMTQYPDSVEACGWVQALEDEWSKKVIIVNDAQAGLSIRTFMDNNGIATLEKKPHRTIMFVQVGTNDLKETSVPQYSSIDALHRRLHEIVVLARKHRVNVVLCTPLAQPYYHNGELVDRLGGYAEAIRRSSVHDHVALVDLEKVTHEWLLGMTAEEAAEYYVTIDPTQLENGEFQLNKAGAAEVAKMAKQAILDVHSKKLKKVFKK